MTGNTKHALYWLGIAAALALIANLAFACNAFDSPYQDAERRASATAGHPAPVVVDVSPKPEQLLSQCVSFYLESEAADFFESKVGDLSRNDEMHCGDDSLWYLDQPWNCEAFGIYYTVARYSRDSELPFELRRVVIPSQGPSWSFRCRYDSECTRIHCEEI